MQSEQNIEENLLFS